jgi:hypothetical protein
VPLEQVGEERVAGRTELDRCVARDVEARFQEGLLEREVLAVAKGTEHDPAGLEAALLNEEGVKENEAGLGDAAMLNVVRIVGADDVLDPLELGLLQRGLEAPALKGIELGVVEDVVLVNVAEAEDTLQGA